jgi:Flp pilus assembly protein TadB
MDLITVIVILVLGALALSALIWMERSSRREEDEDLSGKKTAKNDTLARSISSHEPKRVAAVDSGRRKHDPIFGRKDVVDL